MVNVVFKQRIAGQPEETIDMRIMDVIPRKDEYVTLNIDDASMIVREVNWILGNNEVWIYVR